MLCIDGDFKRERLAMVVDTPLLHARVARELGQMITLHNKLTPAAASRLAQPVVHGRQSNPKL